MKVRDICTLVSASGPLILAGSVPAAFVGLTTVSKPNEFGIRVCNVYAEFDQPGVDRLVAVAGTLKNPLTISVIGGSFFQSDPVDTDTPPSGLSFAGHFFNLDAYRGALLLPDFTFNTPVTVTMRYSDDDVKGMDEDTLILYYWDTASSQWVDAAKTCTPESSYDRRPGKNWVSVPICHLTKFGMFGETLYRIYLPIVLKNSG